MSRQACLNKKTGLLSDIGGVPHDLPEDTEVVEVIGGDADFAPGIPMAYNRDTKRAILHQQRFEEIQRTRKERRERESSEDWWSYNDLTPSVPQPQSPDPIIYPDTLVTDVLDHLERIRHQMQLHMVRTPTASELADLINTCYFASLEAEESRGVQFTVQFFNRGDLEAPAEHCLGGLFPLVEIRPFHVEELVKLALALDPVNASICVGHPEDGTLTIWGILMRDHKIKGARRGDSSAFVDALPGTLRISVNGRGQITFEAAAHRLLAYRSGHRVINPLPVFHVDGQILRFLDAHGFIRRPIFSIARRIWESGHGGILAVLGESDLSKVDDCKVFKLLKYRCAGESRNAMRRIDFVHRQCGFDYLQRQALEFAAFEDELHRSVEAGRWEWIRQRMEQASHLLLDACDRIARMAAVDGALVLGSNLEVVGFGARISATVPPDFPVHRALDPIGQESEIFDLSRVGTRHNSAAALAITCPTSMVFVASEDGTASVFKRHRNRLLIWRPVEMDVFW
jgi:hypothetical protein